MNKKTLVIGASNHSERYSYKAVQKLVHYHHEVIALGNKPGFIDHTIIYNQRLAWEDINTVTLYINPVLQEQYYDYIISLHPKRVIFNPGTENPNFYKLLVSHNIEPIEACTLVMLQTNQY